MSLRIAIVGCGVAGSVLGSLLSRTPGIDLVCYEKALPGDHAESGTGLNVGPNAMKALRLTLPELARDVHAASHPWTRWRVDQTDGTPIFDFALSDLAEDAGIRIRWSELYRVLRAPLAQFARFGIAIHRCEPDPRHAGRLQLQGHHADGQAMSDDGFDLVVACDGRYSALRAALGGPWTPRHVGATIYRALVPDTAGGLIDDYAWWFNGPNRLLAFRVPPDHVYIAGSFPIPAGAEIPDALRSPQALATHYLPGQRAACPPVRWMVAQLQSHHADIHWARLQESPPLFQDPKGQVLFLGDSAHGMVPTLGQGATQSVEDACVAGRLIAQAVQDWPGGQASPQRVAELTSRIAAVRAPRLRWVMDFSMDATAAMLAGADAPAQMARLREPSYQAAFRRLWCDVGLD